MRKNGFTIIEVVVVFLLILGVSFLILPKGLDTTRQARLISKWTEKYSELEYMFSVIKAQKDGEIQDSLNKAENNDDRKQILLDTIKPYLRITTKVNPSDYKPKYMNKIAVTENDMYYFDNHYLTTTNEIIGLKWIKQKCTDKDACAIISFDLNGPTPPNAWGYDIFGINILKNAIQPIGQGLDTDTLKNNCSKSSFGVYCSYYYLMGGKFD